jgi:hypothetical protein
MPLCETVLTLLPTNGALLRAQSKTIQNLSAIAAHQEYILVAKNSVAAPAARHDVRYNHKMRAQLTFRSFVQQYSLCSANNFFQLAPSRHCLVSSL